MCRSIEDLPTDYFTSKLKLLQIFHLGPGDGLVDKHIKFQLRFLGFGLLRSRSKFRMIRDKQRAAIVVRFD